MTTRPAFYANDMRVDSEAFRFPSMDRFNPNSDIGDNETNEMGENEWIRHRIHPHHSGQQLVWSVLQKAPLQVRLTIDDC